MSTSRYIEIASFHHRILVLSLQYLSYQDPKLKLACEYAHSPQKPPYLRLAVSICSYAPMRIRQVGVSTHVRALILVVWSRSNLTMNIIAIELQCSAIIARSDGYIVSLAWSDATWQLPLYVSLTMDAFYPKILEWWQVLSDPIGCTIDAMHYRRLDGFGLISMAYSDRDCIGMQYSDRLPVPASRSGNIPTATQHMKHTACCTSLHVPFPRSPNMTPSLSRSSIPIQQTCIV
jgi:hypothetical protein